MHDQQGSKVGQTQKMVVLMVPVVSLDGKVSRAMVSSTPVD